MNFLKALLAMVNQIPLLRGAKIFSDGVERRTAPVVYKVNLRTGQYRWVSKGFEG